MTLDGPRPLEADCPPEPPLPLPPDELPLDAAAAAAPGSRYPVILKLTVNASLFGLLNFNVRANEVSFGVRVLSPPTFVL